MRVLLLTVILEFPKFVTINFAFCLSGHGTERREFIMMNTNTTATVDFEVLKTQKVPVKAQIIQSILALGCSHTESQLKQLTRNQLLDLAASLATKGAKEAPAVSESSKTEGITKELCDLVLSEIKKDSFAMFGGYRGIKVFSARQITSRYLRGLHMDDSHKNVSLVLNTMFYNKMFSVFTSKKGVKCIRF